MSRIVSPWNAGERFAPASFAPLETATRWLAARPRVGVNVAPLIFGLLAAFTLIGSLAGVLAAVLSNPEMSLKQWEINLFRRRVFGMY